MKMQSNTILITGGTSGIGRGLAEAFHKLGNQVIIAGRREEVLRQICAANPGMKYAPADVENLTSIRDLAARTSYEFPKLNCVINNAGVQTVSFRFAGDVQFDDDAMLQEIGINFAGLVRMCATFVPQLEGREGATIINVSSGLAFVPLAWLPIYCATKAAVHSFTLSLRRQLRDPGIRVIELVPPYVKTELGGPRKAGSPTAMQPMPLDTYIAAAMQELAGDADEVMVGDAVGLSNAGGLESAKKMFARMNG